MIVSPAGMPIDFEQLQPHRGVCFTGYPVDDDITGQLQEMAKHYSYNLLRYTYNKMSFGSPCDDVTTAYIFINPYLKIDAIPEPTHLKYKPAIFETLKMFDDWLLEDDPYRGLADYFATEETSPNTDDFEVLKILPNGWTSDRCFDFVRHAATARYAYHRPYPAQPLERKAWETHIILHPCRTRALSIEELEACIVDNFIDWFDEFLESCAVSIVPSGPWYTQNDIQWSHRPKERKTIHISSEPDEPHAYVMFGWVEALDKGRHEILQQMRAGKQIYHGHDMRHSLQFRQDQVPE